MALVIYEPFEFWPFISGAYWVAGDGGMVPMHPSGISGMDGRCCGLGISGVTDAYVHWPLPSPLATVYMSFLYRGTSSYSGGNELWTWRDSAGTIQATLMRGSDKRLKAYKGWTATYIGQSTSLVNENVTYLINIKYTPHATAGVFQVWFSTPDQPPVLEIDLTNVDTQGGSGSVYSIRAGEQGGHADIPWQGYLDCLAVDDAEIPGLIKAKILLPNAAGYIGQMTQFPNTGNPYDKVNAPGRYGADLGLGDGLAGGEADLIHAFDLTTLNTTGIDQIVAVKPVALGKADWACVPSKLQVGIRSNGNNYLCDAVEAAPGWYPDTGFWETRVLSKLFLLDPYDNSQWNNSKADSLEVVMKTVT
jgi:hypothetical protein